ncbi:nuclear transport factor 2 family protein [Alicyclobacillus curvatus]|jgi:predicted SnoaL-like aldol condensation-catalyzing enzyme|nr:nuclear transport factor 2 family protein [Alicyclobacillus curvatus]
MSSNAQIIAEYLHLYASGNAEQASLFLSDDVSFHGPMQQQLRGKAEVSEVIGHVPKGSTNLRILRQWEDGNDVCSIYEYDVNLPSGPVALLATEWHTLQGGKITSILINFDTGVFAANRRR